MDNYNNINNNSKPEFQQEHFLILFEQKKDLINEINYYELRLDTKKQQLKNIKKYLQDKCIHNYTKDYVSSGLENFQLIEYCTICEELK